MILVNYILYYLVVLPIAYLPNSLAYILSNFLYILLYKIVNYRKSIVLKNLQNAFPNKSDEEINKLCDNFYKHFFDLVIESLQNFVLNDDQLAKKITYTNKNTVDNLLQNKSGVVAVCGHYGNWEWAASLFGKYTKHHAYGIFIPLKNTFWNKKIIASRAKANLQLLAPIDVPNAYQKHLNDKMSCGFIADQSPGSNKKCYWMNFLNQETAVSFGVEKYAKQYNHAVIYGHVKKIKRGEYTLTFYTITENTEAFLHGEITAIHTRINEHIINKTPEYWLWTHKRWKHKRPEGVTLNLDTEKIKVTAAKVIAEINENNNW